MALFTSIDQIKKHVAVNASLSFADLLPFLNRAELLQIKPILGANLYAELQAKSKEVPEEMTTAEKQLLELCQDCTANFAFLLYIPHGLVQLNSGGIHQTQNNTKKPATAEQIKKLEQAYSVAGYQGLETILEYLDNHGADFPTYEPASNALTLLNRTADFNAYVNIGNSRRTFLSLLPIVNRIEKAAIYQVLGPELFTLLKTQQRTQSLTQDNLMLLDYIYPATAYLTIAAGITELSLAITDNGINVYASSTTFAQELFTPAATEKLFKLQTDFETFGAGALSSLKDYLQANLAKYQLFANSNAYRAPSATTDLNKIENSFYVL